jgi:hypothetical protein
MLRTAAVVSCNLLVSHTLTFFFKFLKSLRAYTSLLFYEYFFWPIEGLTALRYREKNSELAFETCEG